MQQLDYTMLIASENYKTLLATSDLPPPPPPPRPVLPSSRFKVGLSFAKDDTPSQKASGAWTDQGLL